jgi:HEAT repeat protein
MYGLSAAHADDVVPVLLPLLEDADEEVRTAALFALGEAAQPTLETIGAVNNALVAAAAR